MMKTRTWRRWAGAMALCAVSLAAQAMDVPPPFDTSNWTPDTSGDYPPAGSESYIRSFQEVTDGVLTSSVIERYWTDSSGNVHVDVVTNGALTGSFVYTPAPPDPGQPPGGDDPFWPDDGEWNPYDPNESWDDWSPGGGGGPVSEAPEPETYAMALAGLGVVGLMARRRRPPQKA